MKNMKKIAVIILSVCLIMVFANSVFAADDDDLFKAVTATNNTSNSTTNESSASNNTNTDSNTSNTNSSLTSNTNTNTNTNTNSSNTANNTARNTNTNSNTNSNTNRNVTNTLAKTGLSNTGSIIALVVVVCGVSAIYSYKKVNDYKRV